MVEYRSYLADVRISFQPDCVAMRIKRARIKVRSRTRPRPINRHNDNMGWYKEKKGLLAQLCYTTYTISVKAVRVKVNTKIEDESADAVAASLTRGG